MDGPLGLVATDLGVEVVRGLLARGSHVTGASAVVLACLVQGAVGGAVRLGVLVTRLGLASSRHGVAFRDRVFIAAVVAAA